MSPLEEPAEDFPREGQIVFITTLEGERAAYRYRGHWYADDTDEFRIGAVDRRIDTEEVISWQPL